MAIAILSGFEIDADRNALHHLYVISGCILRREQAEARAAGAADTRNAPLVLPAVSIHAEPHALARLHPAELRLLEISDHPHIVQLNDGHELLSPRPVLAHFHGLLADNSVRRRADDRIALLAPSLGN